MAVFGYSRLGAERLRNAPLHGLVEVLADAFSFYNGKDSLVVLVTEGNDLPSLFAGVPLERFGITTATHKGTPEPRTHLDLSSPNYETRKINAAYYITLFWRANGLRLIQKMKGKRAHEPAQPQKLRKGRG
ncbi:hypothetical protein Q9L58_000161 [Maublancomyces gigas]|uniref:Uncharacterized protein n=1 Tax=Discina gigas TaxID=1032678 RepID=A0ABR3GYA9_9PEZI